jgi:SAM-dependent methyltransferase
VNEVYDEIGNGYSHTRKPDPRISQRINSALGNCTTVINVGAGSGSYEPADKEVIAIEPSATMIRQRDLSSAPVVQGVAEQLPFADKSFDAALACLTIHHWEKSGPGLAEMRRVARNRIVIFTWDQEVWESFWLLQEYFPCVNEHDRPRAVAIRDVIAELGQCQILKVPIAHDCMDGFHGAFWRRPHAYLDSGIRSAISSYALMQQEDLEEGLQRLAADLESGAWEARHKDILALKEIDLGYRLIVAEIGT